MNNLFKKKTIQIQDIGDEGSVLVEDPSVVNLNSFDVIERLGKGSFGSVYIVKKKSD